MTITYKVMAEEAKVNCVYPSIVGVIKPESTKLDKLKGFQNSGNKIASFSTSNSITAITGICARVTRKKIRIVSNPIISSKDQTSS